MQVVKTGHGQGDVRPNDKIERARMLRRSSSRPGEPSRREVADETNAIIDRLAVEHGRRRLWAGLTEKYIGILERGEIRWPNDEYREGLRVYFGATDWELGLYPDRTSTRRSLALRRAEQTTVDEPMHPQLRQENEDMRRRELLGLIALASGLVALPPGLDPLPSSTWRQDAAGSVDAAMLEHYGAINGLLWRSFTAARTKSTLKPLVAGHIGVLTDALGTTGSQAAHTALCQRIADVFQLAGEVAFDANRYKDASQCYNLAASAAKEASAYDLWACSLTRHAFIAVYERRFHQALPMLELASRIAQNGDQTLSTRYWVSAVRAQALAGVGDRDGCLRALDHADEADQLGTAAHNGGWLRFDGSRLREERGACYVELGMAARASETLVPALTQQLSERRLGSVHIDLALAAVDQKDLGPLKSHALAALTIAERTGSGVVARRLRHLQSRLAGTASDAGGRGLSRMITATLDRASQSHRGGTDGR